MQQLLTISSLVLWILVLSNLALTLALIRRMNRKTAIPQSEGLAIGAQAPHFQAETLSGVPVSLSNYVGQSVAFIFVGPTCPPCREALPTYQSLYPIAHIAGVELVLVSNEDSKQTQDLVDEFGITMPLLIAPEESNSFMKDYKADGTPFYCLIDSQGKVVSSGYPSLNVGYWHSLMNKWRTQAPRSLQLVTSGGG